jgi:histidine kinase
MTSYNIRIYNKQGEIKFSNRDPEIDTVTNIKNEACYICHRSDPPVHQVSLAETVRTFPVGGRLPAHGRHQPGI